MTWPMVFAWLIGIKVWILGANHTFFKLFVREAKLADIKFVSVREFLEKMPLSPTVCYRLLNKGDIPSLRLGRKWLIPADAIEQLMESQKRKLDDKR
jgi:excisionase family DNA binding protein